MRSSQSGRQHCRPPSSSSSSSVAIAGSSSSSSSLAATDRQLQRAVRLSQYRIVDDDNTTVLLRSRYPSSSVATSIPVLVNDASAAPTATASASSPSIPTLDLRHSHLLRSSVPSPSPIIAKRRHIRPRRRREDDRDRTDTRTLGIRPRGGERRHGGYRYGLSPDGMGEGHYHTERRGGLRLDRSGVAGRRRRRRREPKGFHQPHRHSKPRGFLVDAVAGAQAQTETVW
eukprot:CAMPEP_0181120354 /NCGR_PEP_ID=MMETSP1071-20121207/24111_1 /TAXON_ID=35127 /ORGANISM="Thalassiosira sp., Strain NH16" /LENGTH=228 /DNA_ID=CAMNT_0023205003 /DNA_START=199 /DNA_END=882 /DNA_ORIENTATION=-